MPSIGSGNYLGGGLNFIAANSNYVTSAHSSFLDFDNADPYSVSGMIYVTDNGVSNPPIIGKRGNLGAIGWSLVLNRLSSTTFQLFSIRTVSATYSMSLSGALNYNTLYHFICTNLNADATNVRFYIQGVAITNTTNTNNLSATSIKNSNAIWLGRAQDSIGNSIYYNGYMSDIKVFNKVVTTTEISQLAKTRNLIIPESAGSNLVLNYPFENGSGTTLTDKAKGNDGTMTNFVNTSLGPSNQWVNEYFTPNAA